jgi:hypothetical protein
MRSRARCCRGLAIAGSAVGPRVRRTHIGMSVPFHAVSVRQAPPVDRRRQHALQATTAVGVSRDHFPVRGITISGLCQSPAYRQRMYFQCHPDEDVRGQWTAVSGAQIGGAVEIDDGARRPRCIGRGEEMHGGGDLFGRADPAERALAAEQIPAGAGEFG